MNCFNPTTFYGISASFNQHDVEKAYKDARMDALNSSITTPAKLEDKLLIDYLVVWALKLSVQKNLPVQFHTGFGDSDLQLEQSNPLLLKPLLEAKELSKAKIVLVSVIAMLSTCYLYSVTYMDIASCFVSIR